MKSLERIVIDNALLEKKEALLSVLEKLYLGEKKQYQLYVDRKALPVVESLFDQIIMKWGWRPVEFLYTLSQKHLAPMQKN